MMEKNQKQKNFMLKIFSQFIRQIFLMIATSRQKSRAHEEKKMHEFIWVMLSAWLNHDFSNLPSVVVVVVNFFCTSNEVIISL